MLLVAQHFHTPYHAIIVVCITVTEATGRHTCSKVGVAVKSAVVLLPLLDTLLTPLYLPCDHPTSGTALPHPLPCYYCRMYHSHRSHRTAYLYQSIGSCCVCVWSHLNTEVIQVWTWGCFCLWSEHIKGEGPLSVPMRSRRVL